MDLVGTVCCGHQLNPTQVPGKRAKSSGGGHRHRPRSPTHITYVTFFPSPECHCRRNIHAEANSVALPLDKGTKRQAAKIWKLYFLPEILHTSSFLKNDICVPTKVSCLYILPNRCSLIYNVMIYPNKTSVS